MNYEDLYVVQIEDYAVVWLYDYTSYDEIYRPYWVRWVENLIS